MKRFEETVNIELNCLVEGIHTKAEVRDNILLAAKKDRREEITVSMELLRYLTEKYGIVATIGKNNQVKHFQQGA